MNIIPDISWQDDPSVVIVGLISSSNYALSVNGALNASSFIQNGIDLNNIFVKAGDSSNQVVTNYLTVNCNISTSNLSSSGTIKGNYIIVYSNLTTNSIIYQSSELSNIINTSNTNLSNYVRSVSNLFSNSLANSNTNLSN